MQVDLTLGEVIDRLTILEIKSARISDPEKKEVVEREFTRLHMDYLDTPYIPGVATLRLELRKVNEALWQVEDDLRECERKQSFGSDFIRLARSVYRLNDERSDLKNKINAKAGENPADVKSYAPY